MTCRTVREQIEAGPPDAAARAHIAACPACRAEWEFHERLSRAVGGMPSATAPPELMAVVMARVRHEPSRAPGVVAARPRGYAALRPWEIGALVSLCLALLALVPAALSRWGTMPAVQTLGEWWMALRASARAIANGTSGPGGFDGRRLEEAARGAAERLSDMLSVLPGAGEPLAWLCGMAAFAVSLYFLLSWRPASAGREDAHA